MSARPTPPAVVAVLEGAGLRVLACCYCGKPHRHGAAGGAGLRASHCERGPYIVYVSTAAHPPRARKARTARRGGTT